MHEETAASTAMVLAELASYESATLRSMGDDPAAAGGAVATTGGPAVGRVQLPAPASAAFVEQIDHRLRDFNEAKTVGDVLELSRAVAIVDQGQLSPESLSVLKDRLSRLSTAADDMEAALDLGASAGLAVRTAVHDAAVGGAEQHAALCNAVSDYVEMIARPSKVRKVLQPLQQACGSFGPASLDLMEVLVRLVYTTKYEKLPAAAAAGGDQALLGVLRASKQTATGVELTDCSQLVPTLVDLLDDDVFEQALSFAGVAETDVSTWTPSTCEAYLEAHADALKSLGTDGDQLKLPDLGAASKELERLSQLAGQLVAAADLLPRVDNAVRTATSITVEDLHNLVGGVKQLGSTAAALVLQRGWSSC
mmetsp:Transcript_28978/g.94412  ORF Transcript_28978/g.94412 Transcript_28978/m.94412 type:complete len:366 (-) Transcript_28978:5-1102(-)